jgi:hypothetical protein
MGYMGFSAARRRRGHVPVCRLEEGNARYARDNNRGAVQILRDARGLASGEAVQSSKPIHAGEELSAACVGE